MCLVCAAFGTMSLSIPCPSLFFWKKARKTTKKQGFFKPAEPLKSLEKKGKTLEKTRNSSPAKKQGIPKKQGKEGQGPLSHTINYYGARMITIGAKIITLHNVIVSN